MEHKAPEDMTPEELLAELLSARKMLADLKDTKDAAPEAPAEDADTADVADTPEDVAKDIEIAAMKRELAAAKAQMSVLALQAQASADQARTDAVDALIMSGRVGTDATARSLAEMAYDAEQAQVVAYATGKGVSLATATKAVTGLFSALSLRPAGPAPTSIAGGADASPGTSAADVEMWCDAHTKANGGSFAEAVTAYRAANPAQYDAYREGL